MDQIDCTSINVASVISFFENKTSSKSVSVKSRICYCDKTNRWDKNVTMHWPLHEDSYCFTLARYISCAYNKWAGVKLTQTFLSMLAIVGNAVDVSIPPTTFSSSVKWLWQSSIIMIVDMHRWYQRSTYCSLENFPPTFRLWAIRCVYGRSGETSWPDFLDNAQDEFVNGLRSIHEWSDMRWLILSATNT